MGYGLGYIGGSTIPLLIFLVMNAVGVDMLYCLSFIFGFTAVWWAAFSWPLLKNVEQKSYQPHEKGAIRKTLRGLWATRRTSSAINPFLCSCSPISFTSTAWAPSST